MKKPGIIVQRINGAHQKGIIYSDNDKPIGGKLTVYICDDDFKLTGQKTLIDPKDMRCIGRIN